VVELLLDAIGRSEASARAAGSFTFSSREAIRLDVLSQRSQTIGSLSTSKYVSDNLLHDLTLV
jgi:hypothetical protein